MGEFKKEIDVEEFIHNYKSMRDRGYTVDNTLIHWFNCDISWRYSDGEIEDTFIIYFNTYLHNYLDGMFALYSNSFGEIATIARLIGIETVDESIHKRLTEGVVENW
jgi:hypothetical protein